MNLLKRTKKNRLLNRILAFMLVLSMTFASSAMSGIQASAASSSENYVSLFWGEASASNWNQAVSIDTTRAGGSFDPSNVVSGGHFYVEYTGDKGKVEFILQSWSGGSSWGKVSMSESGSANGNYYAKFSYDNCVSTFGSTDFANKLDKVHVGATDGSITVLSVCYDFGSGSSSSGSSSSGSSSSGSSSSGSSSSGSSSSSTTTATGGFYVDGTTVKDANGKAFVMRGVNVAHAWYTDKTETSLKAIAATGANTVRVVVADGQTYSKTSASELQNIINLCKQNKLVCILEVHDATGKDDTSSLNQAVSYWKEMKDILNANKQYVIVNIANEWYGTWDGSAWAEGNKSAIKSLRDAGITNMLIVDSAGWGQYPDSIKNYGKSVFQADSLKNTIFSIHMYEYAGGNSSMVKNNIDNALGTGVPVIIGEFGCKHTDGDVDEYTIMSYCQQKGVGYIGWSWKGNGSTWSYLDLANEWDGSSLSDWGKTLFYDSNGIKNTSKVCSVYSGSSSGGSSSSGSSSSGSSSNGVYTDQNGGVIGLDGVYYIKNANSGLYLDVYYGNSANGTNIQQHSYNGSSAQMFKLVGDGKGYYSILTGCSGYSSAVDVEAKKTANGTNILQWKYNGGNNQKFQIVQVGNAYAIKTKISNCSSALDVNQKSTANGANVQQWTYNGGYNQLWYLEKAN